MYFAVKIVAIACLAAACVTCSSPRRSPNNQFLVPSESQVAPTQSLQNDQVAKQAQQAKLHYMEIGPSLKGDYKFGYDTGSGPSGQSFREETRLDDGTVKGAYGYVDANGKQRIVKYTAGKAGFVVESDQEAGKATGSQAATAAAAAAPAQAPSAPHRPTPVALPQQQHQHHQQQFAPVRQAPAPVAPQQQPQAGNQVNFDEPQQPTLTRQQAEAQHAQQLRQHQLAQQHALSQQRQLAQQQEQQQQLLIQQQQLAAQQQQAAQQHHQHQAPAAAQGQFSGHHQQQHQAPVAQPQFAAPQQHHHQPQHHHHHHQQQQQPQAPAPIVHQFNQNGHFFAQSNDANLGQLLAQQLQQLQAQQQQQQPQHSHQQQQSQFNAPQQQPDFAAAAQRFAAPSQPHFASQPQDASADFGHPVRASRHAHFQQEQAAPTPVAPQAAAAIPRNVASPQSALLALHQQQQHDAQILANLRARQLAQLEQHQRQQQSAAAPQEAHPQQHHQHQAAQQFQQQQSAPVQQFVPQRSAQVARDAPIAAAPQQPLASAPISETPVAAQPEVFGPPVIDIRTLNYSIGQQTRVQ